jgi:hypothetical protein
MPACTPARSASRPSKNSASRLKPRINAILHRGNNDPWEEICAPLNRLLKGWSGYFGYGTCTPAYRAIDNHVMTRVQRFLVRRRKIPSRGTARFSREKGAWPKRPGFVPHARIARRTKPAHASHA